MRSAHGFVSVCAGIAVCALALLVAISFYNGAHYAKIYGFLNLAGRALGRIVVVAEGLAMAGLMVAAFKSRGRIFGEDRWILPMIGIFLVALAIGAFLWFGSMVRGGLP
jgi:hypothetical protein